jgi:hypothetical protein
LPVTSRAAAMAASTSAGAAVDPHRHDFRHAGGDRERPGQRLPGAGALAGDAVAQPGGIPSTASSGTAKLIT